MMNRTHADTDLGEGALFGHFLDALLPRTDIPSELFHYTNSDGLVGILKSSQFFASEYRHLNDLAEIREGWKLASEVVEQKLRDLRATIHQRIPRLPERILNNLQVDPDDGILENNNVYVASFSVDHDSLPQWRAYGDDARGYAIGIAPQTIRNAPGASNFDLVECVYDHVKLRCNLEARVSLLLSLLEDFLAKAFTDNANDHTVHHAERMLGDLNFVLQTQKKDAAAALKNHSFESEREWRFVTDITRWTRLRTSFRPSRYGATPFVCMPMPKTCFSRIVIGPRNDRNAARFGIGQLLLHHGLNARIEHSTTTYR